LPRHIDFLAALVPGLLAFENEAGDEEFLAIDEGVLVKCGAEVMVSTRNAVRGAPLGQLREAVEKQFRVLDEREQQARTVLTKLEADLVGRFIRMGKSPWLIRNRVKGGGLELKWRRPLPRKRHGRSLPAERDQPRSPSIRHCWLVGGGSTLSE
jgi:F-type H+-transporting ATPase subunit epsilon